MNLKGHGPEIAVIAVLVAAGMANSGEKSESSNGSSARPEAAAAPAATYNEIALGKITCGGSTEVTVGDGDTVTELIEDNTDLVATDGRALDWAHFPIGPAFKHYEALHPGADIDMLFKGETTVPKVCFFEPKQ